MKEHDEIILKKIKAYAEQAIQFKGSMDFAEFSKDGKSIAACVFNLGQIGELAGRLDSGFICETKHIPWHKIKGLRNRVIHDYEGLQLNIVWDVLVEFLPELIVNITNLGIADTIS
ncbi:MAG: DUF86 domain-containing protein [Dehalococcoidia bacterium]|nr:DUF86 domain-containing protein [Dehalococcoidia bacterium]